MTSQQHSPNRQKIAIMVIYKKKTIFLFEYLKKEN